MANKVVIDTELNSKPIVRNAEEIEKAMKKVEAEQDKLSAKMEKFGRLGGNENSKQYRSMLYDAQRLDDKMSDLADEMARAKSASVQQAEAIKNVGDQSETAAEKMEKTKEGAKALESINKSSKKASSTVLRIGENAKKSNTGMSKMLRTLFRYTLGIRTLFTLFNKLRSGVREGIDNMSKFNKAVNPINDALSNIKSSLTYMKNSFASAFAPILTTITPAITALMDSVSEAMTKFGMFVAALNGQKTFIKATKVMEDYNQELKETNTQLGKLDELNNVDLSETTKAFDKANSQFEEVNIDEDMFGIAEAFKQGSLGKIIAEALNKGISAIGEEGNEINFEEVGKKIAGGVNDFFATFNFEEFAQTLNTWARGIYTTLKTIIVGDENGNGGIDWGSVWDGVTTLLSNLDLSTVVTLVVGGFIIKNGIVGSAYGLAGLAASAVKKVSSAIGVTGGAIAITGLLATLYIEKISSIVEDEAKKDLASIVFGDGYDFDESANSIHIGLSEVVADVDTLKINYKTKLADQETANAYLQGLLDEYFAIAESGNKSAEAIQKMQDLEDKIEGQLPGFKDIMHSSALSYDEKRLAVEKLFAAQKEQYQQELAGEMLKDHLKTMMADSKKIKDAETAYDKYYAVLQDYFGNNFGALNDYLKTGKLQSGQEQYLPETVRLAREELTKLGPEIDAAKDAYEEISKEANDFYNMAFGTNNDKNVFAGFVLGGKYRDQKIVDREGVDAWKSWSESLNTQETENQVKESGGVIGGIFTRAFQNNLKLGGAVKDSAMQLKEDLAKPGNAARSKLYQSGQTAGSAHLLGMGNELAGTSGVVSTALKRAKTNTTMLNNAANLGGVVGAKTATSINTKANQNKATTDLVSLYEAGADDTEKKVNNPVSAVSKSLSNIGKAIAEGVKNGIVLKKNIFLDALLSLVPENLRQMFSTGLLGAVTAAEIVTTSTGSGGGGSSSYNGFMPDYRSMDLGIPYLASGAVIPPNKEFLAVLGDQKAGTNVEAPLSTIQEAVRNEMKNMKVTVEVVPDKSGIFKAVRVAAQEYTATTGNYAF